MKSIMTNEYEVVARKRAKLADGRIGWTGVMRAAYAIDCTVVGIGSDFVPVPSAYREGAAGGAESVRTPSWLVLKRFVFRLARGNAKCPDPLSAPFNSSPCSPTRNRPASIWRAAYGHPAPSAPLVAMGRISVPSALVPHARLGSTAVCRADLTSRCALTPSWSGRRFRSISGCTPCTCL